MTQRPAAARETGWRPLTSRGSPGPGGQAVASRDQGAPRSGPDQGCVVERGGERELKDADRHEAAHRWSCRLRTHSRGLAVGVFRLCFFPAQPAQQRRARPVIVAAEDFCL